MDPDLWHLVTRQPDYVLASWHRIFCVIWRRETTEDAARHLRDACAEFAKKHPRGIGLLTVVESGASSPPLPARRAIASFLAEGSAYIRCSAVVVEGSGFRMAAARSIVTGLTLLARQRYPHRVCDLREAGQMFAELLTAATGAAVSEAAFRASLDQLREDLRRA
jgi:hypothetical protein